MSEETVEEVAETEPAAVPAVEAQGVTPEAEATETTATEAATEPAETEPERITKAEAEDLAKAEAAKAVANLQRSYEEKLQANAHNAKLAEVLDQLKDQLAGKTPVDPNALPEGFDALPETLQQHFLNLGKTVHTVQQQQAEITRRESVAKEEAIRNGVDVVARRMAADPQNGKLFKEVEAAIGEEISTKPFIKEWVRAEPEEALATLFQKYAKGRIAAAQAQAAAAKATAAVRASSKPATVTGSAPNAAGATGALDPVEEAWKIHGEKIQQYQDAR